MSSSSVFDRLDRQSGQFGGQLGPVDPRSVLVSFLDSDGDASCHALMSGVNPQEALISICKFIISSRAVWIRNSGSRALPVKFIREMSSVDELRFTGNRVAFAKTPARSFIIAVADNSGTVALYERYAQSAVGNTEPLLLDPEWILQKRVPGIVGSGPVEDKMPTEETKGERGQRQFSDDDDTDEAAEEAAVTSNAISHDEEKKTQ